MSAAAVCAHVRARALRIPRPVKSPITGKILQVPHECEGPVTTGQQLLVVGDPSSLEVVVDLLSADAVKVHSGDEGLF